MKTLAPRFTCISLFLVTFYSTTCLGDAITLKEGRTVQGKILLLTKDSVEIAVTKGDLKAVSHYLMSEVEKVKYGRTPEELLKEEYLVRLEKTDNSADSWYALGRWCSEQFLIRRAKEVYLMAISLDPNHEKTRRALGYVKHEGQWLPEHEAMTAKGLVRFEGKWVKPEEHDRVKEERRQRKEKRRAELAEVKRKAEAFKEEISLRRTEKQIALLEKNLEREINRNVSDSDHCHPVRLDRGVVYVPVIVGIRPHSTHTQDHFGLNINGIYQLDNGHLEFNLEF